MTYAFDHHLAHRCAAGSIGRVRRIATLGPIAQRSAWEANERTARRSTAPRPKPAFPVNESTSIRSLTTAMAAGNASAIEAFYRRWFDAMFGMARRAVPNRARDEAFTLDVVHDATLRIVRCVKPMETEAHVLNWTRLVVQSCALDRLRQERRRRTREAARAVHETASGDERDAQEQAEWLAKEIALLEPTLAELLLRRFSDGWTLARIAATLRTTTGQVDGRLRRAIATLRERAREAFDA